VGATLVAGLFTFLVGAGAWRLQYEQPMPQALPVIHADRRRRAWIHLWMLPAMFITTAGVGGYATIAGVPSVPGAPSAAGVIAVAAAIVYAMGAVCWVTSLAFRLTVVPWAAEEAVAGGDAPALFVALDRWAGALYVLHMASAYAAFTLLGAAVLVAGNLPPWVGWLGVGWGLSFLAGFVATRFVGPFNPPFIAHAYTGLVGVMLLIS